MDGDVYSLCYCTLGVSSGYISASLCEASYTQGSHYTAAMKTLFLCFILSNNSSKHNAAPVCDLS